MNKPSARTAQPPVPLLLALAGVALLVAGVVVSLAVWRTPASLVAAPTDTPLTEPTSTAGTVAPLPPASPPAASPPAASPPALALDAAGTPQPFWRVKQQEARARQIQEESQSRTEAAVLTTAPAVAVAGAAPTSPPAGSPTRAVGTGGQTPLAGLWAGSAQELTAYLLAGNRSPRFTVPPATLAAYYVRYAGEVGLRADVLWAQMLHETGFGTYGGAADPRQNNFAGIGATGGGEPGLWFPTAEAGVKAHIAHMAAYVFTEDRAAWTNSIVDPRYDMVRPRGAARVLADLDGRWAVPGEGYGAAVEQHVAAINR